MSSTNPLAADPSTDVGDRAPSWRVSMLALSSDGRNAPNGGAGQYAWLRPISLDGEPSDF